MAVEREMERIEIAQQLGPRYGPPVPITDQLRDFGLGLMMFLTSKPAIDFYSVVAGELRRHEELARAFYDFGPGRTRANLTNLIVGAAAGGELSVSNPEHAADELFGLWQGFTNFQMSLGIDIDEIRRDLPNRIERGVKLFVMAYAKPR